MSDEDELQYDLPNFPIKPLSPVDRRLVMNSLAIDQMAPDGIAYQHTVLCQTCLPYRNQGELRVWEREQGKAALRIEAGSVRHPDTNKWVELGLPFGSKPRLVLMHLNAEAIKKQSPLIEVEDSMTAFVKRVLGWEPNGREIRTMKDQLSRLSSATIRMAVTLDDRTAQLNGQIVDAFDLWFSKDERQRVLWPSVIELNDKYFQSLAKHAVPLHEGAIAALSHSAMALDIYAWLAQRLHRIDRSRPQFITWKAIKDQFGWNYKRMNKFREVFLRALVQAHSQYRAARIEYDERGMTLRNSPPPIKGRIFALRQSLR